ncbi:14328_t:CDS:2, partial [Racocetra fulgida]
GIMYVKQNIRSAKQSINGLKKQIVSIQAECGRLNLSLSKYVGDSSVSSTSHNIEKSNKRDTKGRRKKNIITNTIAQQNKKNQSTETKTKQSKC